MRLINTSTLALEEFTRDLPRYAILSHTWGDEEVSFQLFQTPQRQLRAGFTKIKQFCALAARQSLRYAWVDTCCIDKSSSAELSEAINSMYSWYEKSQCCVAYLGDMYRCSTIGDKNERSNAEFEVFQACRWFTRGWCLQELLAPSTIVFYDQDWNEIGTRFSIAGLISRASGIKADKLNRPMSASIAQKMSWAARRQTTRIEDEAYCLLGIFKVNMPLMYEEGSNAFKRLQQEIIKSSNDESIFAWTSKTLWFSGLLANHPRDFSDSGDIIQKNDTDLGRAPYAITNQGLQIELVALESASQNAGPFESPLQCTREGSGKDTLITLHLTVLDDKKSVTRVRRTGLSNFGLREVTALKTSTGPLLCYVDEMTCDKEPGITDTDLVWWHLDVPMNLGLRLKTKETSRIQIQPTDTERIGFYIVENFNEWVNVSAHCRSRALFYVCWPSKTSCPTSIEIYWRDQKLDRQSGLQWKNSIKQKKSKMTTVEAGDLLAIWVGKNHFLFITLSPNPNPSPTRTTIDIESKYIRPADPLYKQVVLYDPRRNDIGYPERVEINLNPFFFPNRGELYGGPLKSFFG